MRTFLDTVSMKFVLGQPKYLMDKGFDMMTLVGRRSPLNTGFQFHLLNQEGSNILQGINRMILSELCSDSKIQDHKIDTVIHHRVSDKVHKSLQGT